MSTTWLEAICMGCHRHYELVDNPNFGNRGATLREPGTVTVRRETCYHCEPDLEKVPCLKCGAVGRLEPLTDETKRFYYGVKPGKPAFQCRSCHQVHK